MKILKAEFIKSGTRPPDWPKHFLPEVAFGGRSNVGKSSLINSLVNRKKLVKVSGTPGHTQLINFFNVNDKLCLVDLPGYGYAKAPLVEKEQWGHMIEGYLFGRKQLRAMVVIMDLRRGIEDDDMMLVKAAPELKIQPILVFTKADKFSRAQRKKRCGEIAKEMGEDPEKMLLYSSKDHMGREELWGRITQLCNLDEE